MYDKILLVTHEYLPFRGGMGTYAACIGATLRKTGVDLKVVAPTYPAFEGQDGQYVSRILSHQRLTPLSSLRLLAELLFRSGSAFWHAVDVRSVLIVYVAHLLTRHDYGVTIHGSEVAKLSGKGLAITITRAAYARASVVFANSSATASLFGEALEHKSIRITHLGVGDEWFSRAPDSFEDSRLETFVAAGPCICTVGRLEPRKGHKQVLQALRQLGSEGTDIGYVIAGPVIDEGYRRELDELVSDAGVRVMIAEGVSTSDLKRLYSVTVGHVLCAVTLPGKVEGFGLVLLEAAAQGCPSVATRVGGIPEVIRHEETGILVEEGDVGALTGALSRLANDRTLRDQMGGRARVAARSFSWENCASATYRGILDGF